MTRHAHPVPAPRPRSHAARRPRRRAVAALGAIAALGVVAVPALPAGAGEPTATRDELAVGAPQNAPGQTLTLQRVTIPAGVQLVDHYHEGTQVARVVKGVLTYEVLSGTVAITRRDGRVETVTGPATVKIRAGESLVEDESLVHTGGNRTSKPVVIELGALLRTGAPAATPVGESAEGTPVTLTADLTSQATQLSSVGPDGSVTYGWNRLTGQASDPSGPVQVEMLGNVAYRAGSGPFFGFVTFTFADGSVLATRMQGLATRGSDGVTSFAATLGVLGGTGRYLESSGSGTFTGSRAAALGQPVAAVFDLVLGPAQ